MLDVHIRLECGDSSMLQEVELTLGVWCSKNAGWFPTDSVTIVPSMFSWSTLDVASRAVGMIIESKTCLMLFNPFYEGTTGLANIELIAIPTGNFVYDIFDIAYRSSRLDVWQERLKVCIRVEWGANIVACQGFLQGWCRRLEIWNWGHEVAVGATLGLTAIGFGSLNGRMHKLADFLQRLTTGKKGRF